MQDMKNASLETDLIRVDPVISCKEIITISADFKILNDIVKKNYFIDLKK